MKKLDVLLLGWEFPPLMEGESGVACYELAKELAPQVNLSLILPKSDPEYVLANVELTGLNNIDLPAATPVATAEASAFAPQASVRTELRPYGAPTFTGQEEIAAPVQSYPGESASVGNFASDSAATSAASTPVVEELNIFGQTDLSQVDYNSQVIHFARYATRLAARKQYDVIYAYDWMTYLAGIELKLLSGKLLVVHVQSLCGERGGPDSTGWMYETEKQALGKADFVIAQTEQLAQQIEQEYGIRADKIRSLSKLDEPLPAEIAAREEAEKIQALVEQEAETEIETAPEIPAQSFDWQETATNLVAVFKKLIDSDLVSK
jgi:hypothetical protein